jgi:hypothetical protein
MAQQQAQFEPQQSTGMSTGKKYGIGIFVFVCVLVCGCSLYTRPNFYR